MKVVIVNRREKYDEDVYAKNDIDGQVDIVPGALPVGVLVEGDVERGAAAAEYYAKRN